MRRLTTKLVQGISRLAFWRKPAESTAEPSGPADPPATLERTLDKTDEDAPANRTSWLARLKQAWPRRRKLEPDPSAEPDQTVARHSTRTPADMEASDEAPAVPKRSLLAVLKSKLRRTPPSEALEMEPATDESPARASMRRESTHSRDNDDTEDEAAIPPSPRQRALAALSNKWVWIPGLSVMLLVPLIAMALMLFQSKQEKVQLQTQLLATQKKLEQAAAEKKAAAKQVATTQPRKTVVADTNAAATESRPGGVSGECEISDKESVTLNLKNCIDGFNAMTQ